jgi:hypothetical protein
VERVAYVEGASAVVPGSVVGLRLDGKTRRAVVKSISRFEMQIEADGKTIELDLRPTNEATWDLARRYIAERAGVEAVSRPSAKEPALQR